MKIRNSIKNLLNGSPKKTTFTHVQLPGETYEEFDARCEADVQAYINSH